MMGPGLSLSLVMAGKCELSLEDLYGDAALPKLAEMLEKTRYQEVLGVLMDLSPLRPDGFRSRTDWFLVMCLPDYQTYCAAFYDDEGPRLCNLVSKGLRCKIDAFLCRCLESAADVPAPDAFASRNS